MAFHGYLIKHNPFDSRFYITKGEHYIGSEATLAAAQAIVLSLL
jgi:hypothetical protein